MAVPDYQSLMVHVLRAAAEGEVRIGDVVEKLATQLGLTAEERNELLPSRKQTAFSNRVHWAKTYLRQAGLPKYAKSALHHHGDEQKGPRKSKPHRQYIFGAVSRVPRLQTRRSPEVAVSPSTLPNSLRADTKTPDEVMRIAYQEIESKLRQDLLDRIVAAPPSFFEHLIVMEAPRRRL